MNFRLEIGLLVGQEIDDLFNADKHVRDKHTRLGVSDRAFRLIERIPEPEMIYEGDFYHV